MDSRKNGNVINEKLDVCCFFDQKVVYIIKNNNNPNINPSGTSASLFVHANSGPINATLAYVGLIKTAAMLERLANVIFCFKFTAYIKLQYV